MSGSLTALLHLCDSLFPLGSFAHSDGLETATSSGRVATADDLEAWMTTVLEQGLRHLEGPALWRAWRVGVPRDVVQLEVLTTLDAEIYALRPSASGRDASRAMGGRLLKTWRQIHPDVDLGLLRPSDVRLKADATYEADAAEGRPAQAQPLTLPVAFGVVSRVAGIGSREALTGFMYTRLAAIVSAAMRLMSVGQHDGHARLSVLLARLPDAVDAIVSGDEPPRSFTPAMDIAAMRQQYGASRLFRS